MVDCDGDPFPAFPEDAAVWLPQRAAPTRLSVALQIKEFGNEAFQDQAFVTAARKYRKVGLSLSLFQLLPPLLPSPRPCAISKSTSAGCAKTPWRRQRQPPTCAPLTCRCSSTWQRRISSLEEAATPFKLSTSTRSEYTRIYPTHQRARTDCSAEAAQDLEARYAQPGPSTQRLKALYRRGLAYCQVHEFEAAIKDLERALAMAMAGDTAQTPAITPRALQGQDALRGSPSPGLRRYAPGD